jgi:hypothetical protein
MKGKMYPEHHATHSAASEQSKARTLGSKNVDILIKPNLPQGSPTSLLISKQA